ncbi:MAG: HAMP domain-containing histidine kinase [Akkermansiaceae bacterium]|nr:HAMP domain-containing histidine kinase [Akkermansiaceae bacterium]
MSLTFLPARSERDAIELETGPVALRPLISDIAEQFRPSFERRGLSLSMEGPETIAATADADALTQILGNLLSNVEKYAASGGVARIEASIEGSEAMVRVSDHGPGIPRGECERIFLPFRRLDDRPSEGSSGTGLGLAIARDLAERMGGTLRLVSPVSGESGACFELRLPLDAVNDTENVIDFPETRAS